MSAIALVLFAASGAFADQKPAEKCPIAMMKLNDARKMIEEDGYYNLAGKLMVSAKAYADYVKECREEAEKNEKESMLAEAIAKGMKPEVAKQWIQDPKSITLQQ